MSPTAFAFNGIKVYVYFDDHNPIHIHAKYEDYETIFELIIDNGKLVSINQRRGDFELLPSQQTKKVIKFLKKNYKKVVEKWTDVVILHKPIKLTRISGL